MAYKPKPFTSWDEVPIVFDAPIMARITGYTVETVQKKANSGELPGVKEGDSVWRFEKGTVMKFYGADPLSCMSAEKMKELFRTLEVLAERILGDPTTQKKGA